MGQMQPFTLNIRGRLIQVDRPMVMAVINVTPDSFYKASRVDQLDQIVAAVRRAVHEGADIIDLGGCSSRPGSTSVSADEELSRLERGFAAVHQVAPDILVSVDTFRADVARYCVADLGADIVNDISGGNLDAAMFETVADLRVPYILTHMRGTPADMCSMTDYPQGVTAGVIAELAEKLRRLSDLGVCDVIVDPGFGFAKTMEQSFEILRDLEAFSMLGRPILVGCSRKSMLTRLLGITADAALNATSVVNTLALDRGAAFIRVHDVKEAREVVDIHQFLNQV